MNKTIIKTEKSPAAIGPYNQGIVAGGFLYSSGQLPINPVTGQVPPPIEAVAEKMLANKGVQEGTLYRNLIGDYVMNVRDPNGFTSQLIHRVNPFFANPVKSTIRFEHFAYNTPDQKASALWMIEFMDLNIPWSKDIDTTKNNFRNYRVPYVGDAARRMSLELFGKKEVVFKRVQTGILSSIWQTLQISPSDLSNAIKRFW